MDAPIKLVAPVTTAFTVLPPNSNKVAARVPSGHLPCHRNDSSPLMEY